MMDVNDISEANEVRIVSDQDSLDILPASVGLAVLQGPDTVSFFLRDPNNIWVEQQLIPAAQSGPKMRRGDVTSLVDIDEESVVGIDPLGRLIAALSPASVHELAHDLSDKMTEPSPVQLRRGDSYPLVEIGGEPVQGVDGSGALNMRLDDSVLKDIAERIPLPGGRPGPAEMIPDFDAWNVRQDGEMIYFNAHIWGPTAREYLRFGPGDPWANAHSETLLRLVYGDEFTDTGPVIGPDHFTHIMTFNDDAGQAGLNGESRLAVAMDIQRSGRGFAATASDSYLHNCRGPKHWHGVRSETVMGAELAELTQGQGFANLCDTVDQFRVALAPYNRFPAVQAVSILQGATEDSADYAVRLLNLCGEISQKIGARQFNCYQPVGDAFKADYASVLQTPKAFVERGPLPIVLVSPIYWCDRRPGSLVQITPESMTMLAELDGLAGKDWLPPLAFVAERSGTIVTIDFEVMAHRKLVSPSHGLSIVSDNDVEITGWEVVPDPITGEMTRLKVALTDEPRNGRIRYAYDNIEPSFDLTGHLFRSGGDMRDDWSAKSMTGKTLYRYAFAFEFQI
jgi:hypothetical protein